jgi:hypothetical protein
MNKAAKSSTRFKLSTEPRSPNAHLRPIMCTTRRCAPLQDSFNAAARRMVFIDKKYVSNSDPERFDHICISWKCWN